MTDIRQSLPYAKYLSKIGWIVERKNKTNYFIKKIPLLGYILKIQRPNRINFEEIKKIEKTYKSFKVILEPNLSTGTRTLHIKSYYSNGYKISKSPFLPTKTILLNLKNEKGEIFNNFKKDCKSVLKKESQLKIQNCKDLEYFRKCWRKSVNFQRYVPTLSHLMALNASFKKDSLFLLASDEEKNIYSGAIFLKTKDNGYYWQAFTNKNARKEKIQYHILWRGILWVKESGCKYFDFEGIYDKRYPNKSWLGFSHFKKSFGGTEIEYQGCFIKNRFKLLC